MTPQEKMAATLAKAGIPAKEIKCFGSQIIITAWSRDAAMKWADLLAKFAKVRGVVEGRDETKDPSGYFAANPGLVKGEFYHPVWRIGAVIA